MPDLAREPMPTAKQLHDARQLFKREQQDEQQYRQQQQQGQQQQQQLEQQQQIKQPEQQQQQPEQQQRKPQLRLDVPRVAGPRNKKGEYEDLRDDFVRLVQEKMYET